MKIAYLDCVSGISGDMTLGALVDIGIPLDDLQQGIDSLGIAGCVLEAMEVKRHGFRATKVNVRHEPEHVHRHLHHIVEMIEGSSLSDSQKALAIRIFTRLGEAEARVHGTTIEKVHFHEVGAVDSIADIVGSAIGWDLLGVDRVVCSNVPTGSGVIQIAHGRVTVPAPATAELLRQVPLADSPVESELTTPTGAAIIACIVDQFDRLPPMTIERIAYGAGDRDFKEQPNLLRLIVGEQKERQSQDRILVLETNLDDVTGEVVAHCQQRLMSAGALDVFTTAIQMKKGRPAVKLTVLCEQNHREQLERIIFLETETLGIRRWHVERTTLKRRGAQVETDWGTVKGKQFEFEGRQFFTPEYDDCREIALKNGVPLRAVQEAAWKLGSDLTAD